MQSQYIVEVIVLHFGGTEQWNGTMEQWNMEYGIETESQLVTQTLWCEVASI